MEVDGPGSWKTQTCPCKRDNEGSTVKSPSSETRYVPWGKTFTTLVQFLLLTSEDNNCCAED